MLFVSLGCTRDGDDARVAKSTGDSVAQPRVVLRLAVQYDPAQLEWVAADLLRQEIDRRSQGRVRVKLYDSGSLGAEREVLEQCYLGMVDMALVTTSVVTTLDPLYGTLDMPFLFVDEQHQRRVLHGDIGRQLLGDLKQYKLHGLAFFPMGFRHIFNSKRPITRPADLQGLKIRVMESSVMLQSIAALGASATPLSAAEVFTALRTGVVDGAENNLHTYLSGRYWEVCKFLSFTRHFAAQSALVVNDRRWRSLTPGHRQLMEQSLRVVEPEFLARWEASWTQLNASLSQQGIQVNAVDDVQSFADLMAPVYAQHAALAPSDLVERIRREAAP